MLFPKMFNGPLVDNGLVLNKDKMLQVVFIMITVYLNALHKTFPLKIFIRSYIQVFGPNLSW